MARAVDAAAVVGCAVWAVGNAGVVLADPVVEVFRVVVGIIVAV